MKLLTRIVRSSGKTNSAQVSFHLILRRFLLVFLPVAVVVMGSAALLYNSIVESDLKETRSSEAITVDVGIGVGLRSITEKLRSITYDLIILASEDVFVDLISQEIQVDLHHLQAERTAFSRINRVYDQIRWIDLNVEQGKIEQPIKPTIRISTPVFDRTGNSKGIVVFNYLAAELLENFSKIMSTANPRLGWSTKKDIG